MLRALNGLAGLEAVASWTALVLTTTSFMIKMAPSQDREVKS